MITNFNQKIKWAFIVNPAAGGGRVGNEWANIKIALQKGGVNFDYYLTERKTHATLLAKNIIENGCRHIVAVGGDGTAHEVINGIFQQEDCHPSDVIFSLLPIGTGNDWIKTHRIPKKFSKWLACFKNQKAVKQDVGVIYFTKNNKTAKRFFINVVGLSFDGYVSQKSESAKIVLFRPLYYLEMTIRHLFRFKTPRVSIYFDHHKIEDEVFTINVGVCRYSGGGMQIVPHALPFDGLLAVTVVKKIRPVIVLLISPLLYFGKIEWHPKVEFHQTKRIKIKPIGDNAVYAEADGEFLGQAPVEINILPNTLKIIVP